MLRVAPLCRAGGDEQCRHLVVVEILPDRGIGWSAERVEEEGDLLLLDEAARLLDRLGRAIAVVDADERELAAVHPALFVDHLEIGGFGAANHAIGRERPAVGHRLADLDFRIGDAGRVLGASSSEASGGICGGGRSRLQQDTTRNHAVPPDDIVVGRFWFARFDSESCLHPTFVGTFFHRTL